LYEEFYKYIVSLQDPIKEVDLVFPGISFALTTPNNNPKLQNMFSLMCWQNDVDVWLKSINYIIRTINFSVTNALSLLQSKSELFWPYYEHNEELFYYNENIMFRLITLWDLVAQLTNTIFKTGVPVNKIQYKKYFRKYANSPVDGTLQFFSKEVNAYLNEISEFNQFEELKREDLTTPWVGNHMIINQIRNGFTHRINPHIMSVHNGPINDDTSWNLPIPPINELKRLLEDYNMAYKYIFALRSAIKSPIKKGLI